MDSYDIIEGRTIRRYLKIKTVEEEVRNVLTDGKVLLQFVIAAIIEVLRRNSDRYNDVLAHNMSSSTAVPTQETLPLHNEDYKTMILEESNKLYNELVKELVNRIMSGLNLQRRLYHHDHLT